jgi:hypothetical protein
MIAADQSALARSGADVATLGGMVVLPRAPQSVRWRQATRGIVGLGPTDWKLVAVLEYSREDAQALIAELRPAQGPTPSLAEETWLGGATLAGLKGASAYDASAFFRPPLSQGALFRLPDSNTFVLALFTN